MNIPRMNYPQYRKARKLTHECCNYCDGNCLLLGDGEECVCVQSICCVTLSRGFNGFIGRHLLVCHTVSPSPNRVVIIL